MIRLSCSVKLHSFNLAEQLDRRNMLDRFYTTYHTKKDPLTAYFNARKDLEQVDASRIRTFPYLAPLIKFRKDPFANNALFDAMVAKDLKRDSDYRIFIGWSGMSIRCISQAKADGKKILIERGSTHIRYQFSLLTEEYARWGNVFKGDERIARQEEEEYDLADYVVIPSGFAAKTFHDIGFPSKKLFINNYGSNAWFKPGTVKREKFTILYLGHLSLRKGLPYLFQSLAEFDVDPSLYDVWFIGSISEEIKSILPRYQKTNWKFFGHVNHHDLSNLISQCSVAVQPSLEEGLSMVIPQLMACGTPVIATTNTGGEDVIQDGVNGFIVPIRNPSAIAERLSLLFSNASVRAEMQQKALDYATGFGNWDGYGQRYVTFIRSNLL